MKQLLDSRFLKKLENLRLIVRGRFHGTPSGRRLTPRAGMSLEFAEYKEYYPGDDLRYVDWSLYGRFDRLFIKVFTREEDVPIYLFLDVSRSMEMGNKLDYAARLAGALAYLGLKDLNRVGIFPFASDLRSGVPPRGGYRQVFEIFRFLQAVQPSGETSINESLTRFARIRRENGLAILISDMLSEDGYEEGLAQLLHHRYEITVLHLLAPEDLDPHLSGELRLQNVENQEELPIHASKTALKTYQEALTRYRKRLETYCRRHDIRYQLIPSGIPLEETVFQTLREGALLQ
ncbi:MAG: hypothetical protein A2Z21_09640 [Candidatus Fraserbacteria bacterium RBG_16_55_9]|uniref:VWFA domain-containing protein n=1 Tax=Fraserbacteria sp. (strain RBG_16_55_9) TaxID=1817864 RepID=A0A1F5UPY9_FRAXR|nr:MAG: hypothetical protein A2Z21_09640 [Candidatus Fraserbacteria bacterium RBG_16_55_9]